MTSEGKFVLPIVSTWIAQSREAVTTLGWRGRWLLRVATVFAGLYPIPDIGLAV
jgi:hypothetical protein